MAMNDFRWSPSEKRLARKAYDKALNKEKDALILEVKDRAAKIKDIQGVWDLERRIDKWGMEINEKYDYRYSVLPMVFGRLLRESDIEWEDLAGLAEDKMDFIRRIAEY